MENVINKLNKKYALTDLNGQVVVMAYKERPERFYRIQDFRLLLKNQEVYVTDGQSKPKLVPVSGIWLSSKERKKFKNVVFEPGINTKADVYNLWHGFSVKPEKGDWSLFHRHICNILCDDNQEQYNYFLKWCACIVQHCLGKCRRPEVALVLKGIRGIGKDTFIELYGHLFGSSYQTFTDESQVFGRFNPHLKTCVIGHLSEAFWSGSKKVEGNLKSLITNPVFTIEEKYLKPIKLTSHINLVISSNEDWVVPAGIHERRFFIPSISGKLPADKDYFHKIRKQMANGGYEAMLYDFINNYKIDQDFIGHPPKTIELKNQIEITLSTEEQFISEFLSEEGLVEEWHIISTKDLHDKLRSFADTIGQKRIITQNMLTRRIKQIFPSVIKKQVWLDNRKQNAFVLSSTEIMREEFNVYVGYELFQNR